MRGLFRQPITWMVIAEVAVVAVLFAVAWQVLEGGSSRAPLALPVTLTPRGTPTPDEPVGAPRPPSPLAQPRLPGLNVDPAFWRLRLAVLNQAEAQVEGLEWRIVHSAMDTIHRYLETVVLPAVVRAEGRGG